jgi:hypothetical protein
MEASFSKALRALEDIRRVAPLPLPVEEPRRLPPQPVKAQTLKTA